MFVAADHHSLLMAFVIKFEVINSPLRHTSACGDNAVANGSINIFRMELIVDAGNKDRTILLLPNNCQRSKCILIHSTQAQR